MANTDKAVEAVKFVCDNLGKEVYVIDFLGCDECPDVGGESCPLRRPGCRSSLEKVNACREKRVIVRPVDMVLADIHLEAGEDDVEVVIEDCYYCAPGEIFTTREAATAHMESMPADIMKFYECGN